MTELCKNCKYYIKDKKVNNCSQEIVGTVNPNDSACYKISTKENINNFID